MANGRLERPWRDGVPQLPCLQFLLRAQKQAPHTECRCPLPWGGRKEHRAPGTLHLPGAQSSKSCKEPPSLSIPDLQPPGPGQAGQAMGKALRKLKETLSCYELPMGKEGEKLRW